MPATLTRQALGARQEVREGQHGRVVVARDTWHIELQEELLGRVQRRVVVGVEVLWQPLAVAHVSGVEGAVPLTKSGNRSSR